MTSLTTSPSELRIGSRELKTRFFLAPLAGYTHWPLRLALREVGGVGLATTDLILAPQLLAGNRKSTELLQTSPDDRPLSVQIFGGKPEELVRAAQYVESLEFGGIDINMGCPMGKINSSGGGARLMRNCDHATRLAELVVEAVQIPVTVKMRLGWDADDFSAPLLASRFEQVGIAAVTVHGRTRQQGFHGQVNLEGIRKVVEAVNSMPIIGNGDVRTVDDASRMIKQTGCAAIAIGRGAMLDPWLFRKLDQHFRGETVCEPAPDEKLAFLHRHFDLMAEIHDDYACILFRKFAAWYGAQLGIPEDLEDDLRKLESFSHFEELFLNIEQRQGERQTTIPTALIKVPNGPNAHW